MQLTRRTVLAATGGSIALAGCIDGDADDDGTPDAGDGSPDGGDDTDGTGDTDGSATVQVRSQSDHGDILVGPEGLTLYQFDADTQGSGESACGDGCVGAWPPLTVDGDVTVGEDVTAEVTTFERSDGGTQVAAEGWPLYYYANDESPGDATGQGVNDAWWVLRPDGTVVRSDGGGTGTAMATETETSTATTTESGGDGPSDPVY